MRILNPALTESGLWDTIARAPARALLLDYDGTLAPFAARRDQASPYPGVREALSRLQHSGTTRLAIVSGRPARVLGPTLDLSEPIEVWGSHGLERLRANGEYEARAEQEGPARTLGQARDWIAARGWSALCEPKPFGLALHGRGVSPAEFENARREFLDRWQEAMGQAGLETLEFDGGLEWRPAGSHKGEVVQTVLAELPRAGALAYLGDDRTDEDAFASLSGRGLPVLVRPEFRETAADIWLRPPAELLDFLGTWLRRTAGRN